MPDGRNDRLADVLVNYIEGLRRNDALGEPAERNRRLALFIGTLEPKDLVVGASAVDEINRSGVAFALQGIGEAKDAAGDELRALLARWERQDREEQDRDDWADRRWGLRVDPWLGWRTEGGVELPRGAHVLATKPVIACGGDYDWLPAPEHFTVRHVPSPIIRRWRHRRGRAEEAEVAELALGERPSGGGPYCSAPKRLPAPPVRRLARRYRLADSWGNRSEPLGVTSWGGTSVSGVSAIDGRAAMNVRCIAAGDPSVRVRWLLPWAEGGLRECLVDLAADEADIELGPTAAGDWEQRARQLEREFTRSLEIGGLLPAQAPAGWTFRPSEPVTLADGAADVVQLDFTCPTPGRLALAVEISDLGGEASATSEVVVIRGGPGGVELAYAAGQ